ncbi:MAG: hypothetical protein JNJ41_00240 [Bacteroidia bacterium]|nr:hypothetical protein [Bacteroidia bacterium]
MLDINNGNIDWTRDSDITIKEVKSTEGLTHLTDEQASEVVEFIKTYSMLIHSLYKKQIEDEQKENENQKIISMNNYEPIKNAA